MEDFEKLYNKALRFLSFRPRSEKEIRDYLNKRIKNQELSIKNETIAQIIAKLKEQRFLDDIEFAKWWMESRIKYRQRAMRVIKQELKMKGISKDTIDSAISNFQFPISNDMEMALGLAKKKVQKLKNLERKKAYEKLGRYLASKGFDWDTIKEVIDRILPR